MTALTIAAMAQKPYSQAHLNTLKSAQHVTQINANTPTPETAVERAGPLWSEDFNGGVPAGWNIVTTGNPAVEWKYTTVGHTGDYPTAALESTTAANGWMIVDSDADNFSGGPNEDTKLASPMIDNSGSPFPANVMLGFEQMMREWQSETTTISVSSDSTNWTDFIINEGIGQGGHIRFIIPTCYEVFQEATDG